MADEPLQFPTGADIRKMSNEAVSRVEVKTRAIMLSISASNGKQWTPKEIEDCYQAIYKFLTAA